MRVCVCVYVYVCVCVCVCVCVYVQLTGLIGGTILYFLLLRHLALVHGEMEVYAALEPLRRALIGPSYGLYTAFLEL